MRDGLLTIVGLLLALAPRGAAACSVCFGTSEESRVAFIVTTVFLSVLPLALIGGLVWWVRRRVRAAEARADDPANAG